MKEIRGYVFVPHFKCNGYLPLFGPSRIPSAYANLSANGMRAFAIDQDAIKAGEQFSTQNNNVQKIRFGKLEIIIAQDENEIFNFKDKDHLIVISNPEADYVSFYGPIVKNKPAIQSISAAELSYTKFETFTVENSGNHDKTPFERAYELGMELNKIKVGATLAIFNLTFLKKTISSQQK